MDNAEDEIRFLLEKTRVLLSVIDALEVRYPSRKFSLDGHLFGSIGELCARYYGLNLLGQSEKCHDAFAADGRKVQIKITQINSVDIQSIPECLSVIFLDKSEVKLYEVYNGPGQQVLAGIKPTKSGYYNRSLNRLSGLDSILEKKDRIGHISGMQIEKWHKGIKNR